MKRILVTFLCLLVYLCVQAQTIKGIVYRGNSDTVIANATVYYSGTMKGTITDNKGRFEMPAKQQQIPVIVSCIGYYSAKETYQAGKPLIVHLKPKAVALNEVTIRVDGMNRRDEEAAFIREFIGVSPYALSCTITNLKDVNLFYSKKTRILSANCDKPINIVNKKLGYTISYYLDMFEKSPKEVKFAGNYTFAENIASAKDTTKINRNREEAYDGSRMQLVRALWHRTLNKTNFKIYTPYFDPVGARSIIITDSLKQKYIHFTGRLLVINKNNTMHTNPIIQQEPLSFIDKDGFYGVGILWSGDLGNQRVGDLLPFEYQSKTELKKGFAPDVDETEVTEAKETPEFADKVPKRNLTETERNIRIFKNLVMVQDNPINNQLVVKKWQQPVHYKIYGSSGDLKFDAVIKERTAKLFDVLSAATGLEMKEANDSTVNFTMLIGTLKKFKNVIDKEAYGYFSNEEDRSKFLHGKKSTGYYTWSVDGFTDMVQLVETNTIGSNAVLWCQIKAQIMCGLGFFGQLGNNTNSLFYRGMNYWTPDNKIEPFDSQVIKTLYQPVVKSGMTERQLDNILNGVQL